MPDKKKLKAVLTHPRIVKLISIITALCMIATLAVNAIVMYAASQLKWGFYNPSDPSNRFSPKIEISGNMTNINIAIPVYVNNTASFGFDVMDVSFDFSIGNSSGVITHASSPIGNIPHGNDGYRLFNLTLIDSDPGHIIALGASTALTIEITLHVTYVFTTVTLTIKVTTNGGLTI